MITLILLMLICFISLTYSYEQSTKEYCNAQDKKTLLKIKESFGNPYCLYTWNPENDCCMDFEGVSCPFGVNRVVYLDLSIFDLSGQIPPEVGDLTYLETLYITGLTNLTGPIQPAIAKLKHLTGLTLHNLNLTGSIPSFLGQLKNLTTLNLAYNYLSGSIPSSLSELTNLSLFDLSVNKLTGTIPNSFGKFKRLDVGIYLNDNQLSGKIPASLGKMKFSTMTLSRNKLEGDATMLFGSDKVTYWVDLSENLLEFDLSNVTFSNNMATLDLSHNKVYGKIPSQLTHLKHLQGLNVSYNRLCGQIPQGGKLQSLDKSSYIHNQCLCGSPLDSCK